MELQKRNNGKKLIFSRQIKTMALLRIIDSFLGTYVPLKSKIECIVFEYIIPDESNENQPNNEQIDIDTIENSTNSSIFADSDF